MSQIGNNDSSTVCYYDIMRGHPAPLESRIDKWEVPGIDGYGAQTLGLGNGEFSLRTVAYFTEDGDTPSNIAEGLFGAAASLVGGMVKITDDWGINYTDILALEVRIISKTPCFKKGDSGDMEACVRCEQEWKMLQCVSLSP